MASASAVPSDRVVKPASGSGFHLLIFTMYEKPGWRPRVPASHTRPPHPGSAIDYGGELYEVIDIGPGQGTAYTYRYGLRKWEDRFVVRRIFSYGAEAERAVARQVQERRARHRRHSWLVYTFPLSTWLPSPVLQRWQSEWGLPMYGLSLISALLFALPCADLALHFLFFVDPPVRAAVVIFSYVAMEQGVRAIWIVLSRQAQGSSARHGGLVSGEPARGESAQAEGLRLTRLCRRGAPPQGAALGR